MQYIFSGRNAPLLKKLTQGHVLLAFDFDGTLAPIVSTPDGAALRSGTRSLLTKLAARCDCIVVSGRSRKDVRKRLRGVALKEIIGNHGIEPWGSSKKLAKAVRTWIPVLHERLRTLSGVVVEGKQFSASVHLRHARHKRAAIRAVHEVAATLRGARLVGGKQVVNIVPRGAPDKGDALKEARRRGSYDTVVYVGDDETDEHAFAVLRNRRSLGIRVGNKQTSLARYYIRNQKEMDRLLSFLIASCRPETS
jgi:trehalose 6-phosphate phosphatase